MAIKNWHGGKLVLVWVVFVVPGFLLMPLWGLVIDNAWYAGVGGRDMVIVLVLLGLAVALLATPLVVSWKWFSSREKNTGPPNA